MTINAIGSLPLTVVSLSRVAALTAAIVGIVSFTCACSKAGYEVAFTSKSPDGAYIAQMDWRDEGTLGSSRYRVTIMRTDGTESWEVFRGTRGWTSAPVWQNASSLQIPFCLGSVGSVNSVLPIEGAYKLKFRTSDSSLIHVHAITAPNTIVDGLKYCEP